MNAGKAYDPRRNHTENYPEQTSSQTVGVDESGEGGLGVRMSAALGDVKMF